MTPEEFIAAKASEAVKALYGQEVPAASLQVQVTRKEFEGDYTLVVFPLLRISHSSPDATGTALGEWFVANLPEISAFNSVKGFLNLSLSRLYWLESFSQIASAPGFGQLPPTGKTVMVEFSSPNTNKPLHLGHIRNNLLGDSVSRLLAAAGNKVIKCTLVNDRGVHICKSMYAWQQLFGGATPESTGMKGDHFVGDCYVAFDKMFKQQVSALVEGGMSEEEARKEAPCMKAVHEMLVKWEEGDAEVRRLWEMMNGWVFKGFDETYAALGISFDQVYYEHDTYLLGKSLVQRGLDMGVFVKDPDGSVWCDLTSDGLDRKLLLRSDGTSVYMTQDLGTAERRFAENSLDSHIYVVGDEQNYHFQVLKLVLGKLGFPWADQIYHLSYGMVELPDGKMKSREGTVVDADDLIASMKEEAKGVSEESGKLDDVPEKEKEELYSTIGLGALKYFILKVDPKKKMLFNPKESIDFNGNTGPFIQYTYARIRSILRKAASGADAVPEGTLPTDFAGLGMELQPKEVRLVQILSSYPRKVKEASDALSPALVANYCYDLAKEFNQYYHDTGILREEDAAVRGMRLVLARCVSQVLGAGMGILGIGMPDRM